VWKSTSVRRVHRQFFTKSFPGDDATGEQYGIGIATPSNRRRVDGVKVDVTIQHERTAKF